MTYRSAGRPRRLVIAAGLCLASASAIALGVLPQQEGTVNLLTQANVTITAAASGDQSGWSVAGAGDVNGDGLDDVIVGALLANVGSQADAGSSYVIYGRASQSDVNLAALGSSGFRIDGADQSNWSGESVAGAGDVNGDGLDDVLVGAPYANPSSMTDAGTTYVVYGRPSPSDVDLAALGSQGFRIDGAHAHDASGWSVDGAGDINGDGLADIIVGAPDANPLVAPDVGQTYVVYGQASTSDVDLSALGSRGYVITGAAPSGHSGYSVAGAGDVNGDGRPDVIVGARNADPLSRGYDTGASYVVYSQSSPSDVDLGALGQDGFRIDGAAAGDFSGTSVDGAGDVNGDGFADVIVGAPEADTTAGTEAGAADVIFGGAAPANVDTAGLGLAGFRIAGGQSWAYSGTSVAGAGDINGDGFADVIVGTPIADAPGVATAGVSDVIFGQVARADVDLAAVGSRGIVINGALANETSGNAVAGAGDVNGDGRPDVIVGAQNAHTAVGLFAGESYIVNGFGPASVSYPGPVAGTPGTPIAAVTPAVARTGPAAFAVSPALPAGLTLNTSTGVISGTPAEVASGTFTVTMTDLSGAAHTAVMVAVTLPAAPAAAPPSPPMVITPLARIGRRGIPVGGSGRLPLTLQCPGTGGTCTMQGGFTTTSGAARPGMRAKARAAVTVASFRGVVVKAGSRTTISVPVAPAVLSRLRAADMHRLATTLTIRSTADGETTSWVSGATLLLPRVRVAVTG